MYVCKGLNSVLGGEGVQERGWRVLRRERERERVMTYLKDTAKAYVLQANGEYIPRSTLIEDGVPLFNSQNWLMENPLPKFA